MAKISEQLRQAIRESGMSRYRIWKETGITQSSLCRFMQGEGVSLEVIDRLADLLDLSLTKSGKPLSGSKPRKTAAKKGEK